jgi:GWxTD domain-containing protein
MKRKTWAVALLIFLLMPAVAERKPKVELPEKYKKWLDEEVVYIITSKERDIFLQLQTDREREIFIEAFWKQRDSSPGTPHNEFKEEHYRRLQYANEMYGRSTPLPGWRTDRGRIYIILGPPKNIETYDSVMNVYPTEIWFYLGDPALGLPTAFNVIFFKKEGTGDYILYSPADHGPQSLIADSMVNARSVDEAYSILTKYEPNLARQTLSLIPGERVMPGTVSLASTRLIGDIYASPQKKVEDTYAEAILKFKDFVDVEYTANYVNSDACLQVIQDDSGAFLVHYSIEPSKISVEDAGGKYNVRFRLTGRVSDPEGKTIYQFDKDFPFTLTPTELQEVRSKSISLQDIFPLVPGSYNFDILLKNALSKEFTGAEKKIVIPGDATSLQMSPLLLAYGAEEKSSPVNERVPFKSGDKQILCQSKKTYSPKDSVFIFFQVYGLIEDLQSSSWLQFTFFKEDKEFSSRKNKVSDYGPGASFVEVQDLKNFPPGYYQVRVSLLDAQGQEVLSQKENFEISFLSEIPRPLVISKVIPSFKREDYLYTTGLQYFNKGNLQEAKSRLSEAYHKSPQRLEFALGYSQALFILKDYQEVKETLLPFANGQEVNENVLYFLGKSCHSLGQYQEAISYYQNYLSHVGTNLEIFNLLGTCYYQLGNKEEALRIWQKSLEISPNQENIRKLVESIKKQAVSSKQ